ncbi:hypothetical protein LTR08_003710 [Meristemomyces frigidus]|nr:hypothetical protein LTR08_003710 [Meristemomyces frigidus]
MKRWQDCGEVLDSDDEDVSFSNDSQSPEKARKRVKLDNDLAGDDASSAKQLLASENDNGQTEEDEPWLQPKVATTYTTRKVRAVEIHVSRPAITSTLLHGRTGNLRLNLPISPQSGEDRPGASSSGVGEALSEPYATSCGESEDAEDNLVAGPKKTQSPWHKHVGTGRSSAETPKPAEDALFAGPFSSQLTDDHELLNASQFVAGRVPDHLCGPIKQAENNLFAGPENPQSPWDEDVGPGASSAQGPNFAEDDLFARFSQSTDDNDLPNASQFLAGQVPQIQDAAAEDVPDSSGLSSPLTECSPSPPPEFRMPTVGTVVARSLSTTHSPHHNSTARSLDDGILAASILETEVTGTLGSRRQLRDRKQKQYHPYQFEKTAYQQQMRKSGIRPVHFTVIDSVATETETQEQIYSSDQSDSQQSESEDQHNPAEYSSPPARLSPASGGNSPTGSASSGHTSLYATKSDDEFPDIDTLVERAVPGALQDRRKRRKLFHLPRASRSNEDHGVRPRPQLYRDHHDLAVPRFRLPRAPRVIKIPGARPQSHREQPQLHDELGESTQQQDELAVQHPRPPRAPRAIRHYTVRPKPLRQQHLQQHDALGEHLQQHDELAVQQSRQPKASRANRQGVRHQPLQEHPQQPDDLAVPHPRPPRAPRKSRNHGVRPRRDREHPQRHGSLAVPRPRLLRASGAIETETCIVQPQPYREHPQQHDDFGVSLSRLPRASGAIENQDVRLQLYREQIQHHDDGSTVPPFAVPSASQANRNQDVRPQPYGGHPQSYEEDPQPDDDLEVPLCPPPTSSDVDEQVRAALTRCYYLVIRCGWWKCEVVLGSLFDFFARRNLAPLDNEKSGCSPRFLEELSSRPPLGMQAEDPSFHVLLKTLAVGLLGMRNDGRYSDKKIGGMAWRFIPIHSRLHGKDDKVRQTDIDALRNHHDLLCTLYFASPAGYRPRLDLLRDLVDHSTSHRDACRISVRSWSNLASFQASTDEPIESLRPFTLWFQEIIQSTISQYRLAKTEAEHESAVVKARGASAFAKGMLTAKTGRNQRQIAATLVDALAGLSRALRAAKKVSTATALVEGTRFWTVFTPFDAAEKRLLPALNEALKVAETALKTGRELGTGEKSQGSDESQDYGDPDALDEYVAMENQGTGAATIADLLLDPIGQLLSNVFGADNAVDDVTLVKLVDIWVQLAAESVRTRKRSWASYLDEYSANSWRQLRATEQRRKYTPHFLACVVRHAPGCLDDVRTDILTSWLVSLVDTEATLKYQHELTAALLNNLADEPLLSNLPFAKGTRTAVFHISLPELRQRRIAVISSVLSSMRNDFDNALYSRPQAVIDLRQMYSDMLRSVMQAMKGNFQDHQVSLTAPSAVSNLDIHGAYVDFVQHVVSSLQEHTADICRVDPFFTDSSAFPLPSTDPTYVVGRLRGYVPKLAESKTRKLLATFMHTLVERAVVDGQQPNLVDQLCSAMNGVLERGSTSAPTLRYVVLTAIFPAYIETVLSTACSWILTLPLLRTCERVFDNLLYSVVLESEDSIGGVVETMEAVLNAMYHPLKHALLHPDLLRLPHVQKVLALIFNTGRSALTLCGYLQRATKRGRAVASGLRSLYMLGQAVSAFLSGSREDVFDPVARSEEQPSVHWADTKVFAKSYVDNALEKGWHVHNGQYFVKRGNISKEVAVALGNEEDERRYMLQSIERFSKSGLIIDGQTRQRAGPSTWHG